jgi:hypothetical protein
MELGSLLSPAARREAEAQAEAAMEEEREAISRSAERAKQQLRVEARECTRVLLDDVPGSLAGQRHRHHRGGCSPESMSDCHQRSRKRKLAVPLPIQPINYSRTVISYNILKIIVLLSI